MVDSINKNLEIQQNIAIDDKKSLLRPITNNDKYKTEDLIKLHEFKRESIMEPFQNIENKDYFAFTSEDDPKYKFTDLKYMVRSKLMIKSIFWSFGIGSLFFLHRYYRKKRLIPALNWGFKMWSISFYLVWGSMELQPFVMSLYYSKFIENLSAKDIKKFSYYNYLKGTNDYEKVLNTTYGIHTYNEYNQSSAFAKFAFEYDNNILKYFNYKPMILDKILIHKEQDDLEEDFQNKDLFNKDFEANVDYDFSFHKENNLTDKCNVNLKQFFTYETENNKLTQEKINILKNDQLTDTNLFNTKEMLKQEIIICENYLNDNYKNIDNDPEYERF